MRLIDTHSHINFKYFKDDSDAVIQHALSEGVWLVNVGADMKTSRRAIDIANRFQRGVYAAVGLHPIHIHSVEASDEEYDFKTRGEAYNGTEYEKLARLEKVVAIGEIGLDYYHLPIENATQAKRLQKEIFIEQLTLARRLNLPAIIHCRDAHDDMLLILSEFRKAHRATLPPGYAWGVMHCFTASEDLAWKYFNLGLYVSFTGVITFSNQYGDLIRKVPLDRIMVETDCPFMAPEPFRGKRNEPALVKLIAQRIAEIKQISLARVAEETTNNALRFFRINE